MIFSYDNFLDLVNNPFKTLNCFDLVSYWNYLASTLFSVDEEDRSWTSSCCGSSLFECGCEDGEIYYWFSNSRVLSYISSDVQKFFRNYWFWSVNIRVILGLGWNNAMFWLWIKLIKLENISFKYIKLLLVL